MEKDNMFNISMFILRLALGMIFLIHGAQKLFGTFQGPGLEGTARIVEGLGFADPYFIGLVWACTEFVGGVFLVLGIFARWAAVAVLAVTVVQLWKTGFIYGSFVQSINIEHYFLIIGAALSVILMGGGSWSVWDK